MCLRHAGAVTSPAVPPGWYPDPYAPTQAGATRWWDGSSWSPHAQPTSVLVPVADRPLAHVGRRLVAQLVDAVLLVAALALTAGVLVAVLVAPLGLADSSGTGSDSSQALGGLAIVAVVLVVVVAAVAVPFCYQWLLIARDGQTLGKKALGIRAVRLSDNGVPSSGQAALRVLVSSLLGSVYIDSLWCLWDKPWRQCLHDKAAGTIVVPATSAYRSRSGEWVTGP